MKSRSMYHKYLQERGFIDIIDPPNVHLKSKAATIIFLIFVVTFIFLIDFLKRVTVASLETSPQASASKYLEDNSEP